MKPPAKILLVEDDSAIVATLRRVLADEGYEVAAEKTGDAGLARAKTGSFDVVVTDFKMPGLNGLELVRKLHVARPRLPILMMTAHGTAGTAIEAMQSGAYDYLLKPFEMPELLKLVGQAVAASRLMSEPVQIGEAAQAGDAIVGNSRAMQSIYKEIGRIAAKPVSVLTCVPGVMSPISSRKIVPWSACSKRPMCRDSALVNAPRSWPNNSLSSNVSGMAAQLMATNGAPERWLCW